MRENENKFKLILNYNSGCDISSFISSSIRNFKITNILTVDRPMFSFIFQKSRMLMRDGNKFWKEALPYGKPVQEKSKHRISHMEKMSVWNKSS